MVRRTRINNKNIVHDYYGEKNLVGITTFSPECFFVVSDPHCVKFNAISLRTVQTHTKDNLDICKTSQRQTQENAMTRSNFLTTVLSSCPAPALSFTVGNCL